MTTHPILRAGAVAVGSSAALITARHVVPAVTAFGPLRRAMIPALAGIGAPDHVAVTFDDGPDPRSTPQFLSLLAREGISATFFLLGEMASKSPALTAEIAAAGHEVAVHGWAHRLLLKRGLRTVTDDIGRARDLIGELTGTPPRWYRPPYGVLTRPAVLTAAKLGLTPVLWTCWGRDWTARATPDSVLVHIQRRLRGGGTVLLHDSDCTSAPGAWQSALGAIPTLVGRLREMDLQIGPLREHGVTSGAEPVTFRL
ncbi:MAG: polysaccharide deacetylase family protein [Streptosporangiales bacterium]